MLHACFAFLHSGPTVPFTSQTLDAFFFKPQVTTAGKKTATKSNPSFCMQTHGTGASEHIVHFEIWFFCWTFPPKLVKMSNLLQNSGVCLEAHCRRLGRHVNWKHIRLQEWGLPVWTSWGGRMVHFWGGAHMRIQSPDWALL